MDIHLFSKFTGCILALLSILCTSCQDEHDIAQLSEPNLSVSLQTRAISTTDPLSHNINEYRITVIRAYVFNADGTLDATFYDNTITPDAEAYKSTYFKVSKYPGKRICVIVNEPANIQATLDMIGTYQELQQQTYLLSDCYNNDNIRLYTASDTYCLPMYGELNDVNVPNEYNDATIVMTRCVARVDLYLTSDFEASIDSLSQCRVSNLNDRGYLLPENYTNPNGGQRTMSMAKDPTDIGYWDKENETEPEEVDRRVSFYLPEEKLGAGSIEITLSDIYIEDTHERKTYTFNMKLDDAAPDCVERNKVYRIFANMVNGPDLIDLLYVCVMAWENDYNNNDINLYGESQITNCYVLAPGARVHIPLKSLYNIYNNDFSDQWSLPDNLSYLQCSILWQSDEGVIDSCSVESIVSFGDNGKLIKEYYLYVRSGSREGNAVVAFYDHGTILWSYHIWNTTYEPNETAGQCTNAQGQTEMTRDLGALTATSTGLYYQNGRKDPFLANNTGITDPPETAPNYWEWDYAENVKYYTQYPTKLCSNWDAYWDVTSNLWRKDTDRKGLLDPCPDGWKISDATFNGVNLTPELGSQYAFTRRCVRDE